MLTEDQQKAFYAPVLTMLKKSDGTEVEPIIDSMAGFFACELIDDELFLVRNAFPEELEAYYKREEARAIAAEKEKERLAAERAEKEQRVREEILSTIQPHKDGKFRLVQPEKERTYAFESAEDAADFACWNIEHEFGLAPEPESAVEEPEANNQSESETLEVVGTVTDETQAENAATEP